MKPPPLIFRGVEISEKSEKGGAKRFVLKLEERNSYRRLSIEGSVSTAFH